MNLLALTITLLLFWGDNPTAPKDIWTQVTSLETQAHKTVKDVKGQFGIASTNPARGYYIPGKGVVLVVPLRFRTLNAWLGETHTDPAEEQTKKGLDLGKENTVTPSDLKQRMTKWQEQQKAYELTREANFQRVVTAIKVQLPKFAETLSALEDGEELMVAVEEAPPAYHYANFSLKKNPTRRLVTFRVTGDLFQLVKTNKVRVTADWLAKVESTTTRRALASAP